MKFSEIPYTRPDPERLKAVFGEMTERLKSAKNYEEARAVFLEFEEMHGDVNTMDLVAMIRRNMFEDDEFYKEEDDFWWGFEPRLGEYIKAWSQAMLDSPFRREFEAEYGDMMFLIARFDRDSTSEAIVADKQRENKLIVEYGEAIESVEESDEFKDDPDPERRREAYISGGAAWREAAERLDRIFDGLVHLRDGMGRKMGCGYIDLAYRRLHRTFTKEDVKGFREAVQKYVVPVADAIKRRQAERIGSSYPMPYSDNEYFFKSGNPRPAGDAEFLIEEGKKFFETLSPEAAEFFSRMIADEMIFAHAGGGNDIYLPRYQMPFIMVDLDGSGDSVRSFMHEAGHTFAYWMNRDRIPLGYITPSEDVTELHSMCMELLALQHAEGFFGSDAKKFTYALVGESVAFITYGTMVDHFQHSVFEHPEWSCSERHAEWMRLEAIYEPWIAFDKEMPYYGEGMLWQQQGHIFEAPFMYIDYVLTGVVALEVWAIMQNDPGEAWERYMALVSQGGTRPFAELIKNAGLHSPFDETCLKRVSEAAKKWLDEFDTALE